MTRAYLPLLSLVASVASSPSVWTVNCDPLTIQRSDPITTPGIASSHVNSVVGGTAFRRNMSGTNDAVNAKGTTCDKFTDHSNYFIRCPQLYEQGDNGYFTLVPFTGGNFYYKNYTCDHQPSGGCAHLPREARAFPPGFRMLVGDTTRRSYNDDDQTNQAILFTSGTQMNIHELPTSKSNALIAWVRFPSCWNRNQSDSEDHKSHIAYPDPARGGDTIGGMCPSSHPYALIYIAAQFGFDLTNVVNMSRLVFSNGDSTGYGFQAGFIQGWQNLTALQQSFANCFDNGSCPWRAFGTPDGNEYAKHPMDPETPAIYEEEIGLNGPILQLPGTDSAPTLTSTTGTSTSESSASTGVHAAADSKSHASAIAGGVVGGLASLAVLGLLFIYLRRYLRRRSRTSVHPGALQISPPRMEEVDLPPPNYQNIYPDETIAPGAARTADDDELNTSSRGHSSSNVSNLETQGSDDATHPLPATVAIGRTTKVSRFPSTSNPISEPNVALPRARKG